uniref:Uncharacterized protein n=1 Tax=Oryza glaberrima TaxID=4538 RepID=I1R4K0_ORYGL
MFKHNAFNVFIWIDAGAESTAFLDGGSIEEAPCISARLPSCERSGKREKKKSKAAQHLALGQRQQQNSSSRHSRAAALQYIAAL